MRNIIIIFTLCMVGCGSKAKDRSQWNQKQKSNVQQSEIARFSFHKIESGFSEFRKEENLYHVGSLNVSAIENFELPSELEIPVVIKENAKVFHFERVGEEMIDRSFEDKNDRYGTLFFRSPLMDGENKTNSPKRINLLKGDRVIYNLYFKPETQEALVQSSKNIDFVMGEDYVCHGVLPYDQKSLKVKTWEKNVKTHLDYFKLDYDRTRGNHPVKLKLKKYVQAATDQLNFCPQCSGETMSEACNRCALSELILIHNPDRFAYFVSAGDLGYCSYLGFSPFEKVQTKKAIKEGIETTRLKISPEKTTRETQIVFERDLIQWWKSKPFEIYERINH